MEDFKQEYLAMRREEKRGYGRHSFEEGLKGEDLRRECIRIIKERKFFENNQLYKSMGAVIGSTSQYPRVSNVVTFVKGLSYYDLSEIYLLLLLHKR